MVPDDDVTNEDESEDVEDVDSDGQTGGQTGGQSGGQTGGQTGGQSGGQTGGQTGGQSGGQSGGQTGGQSGGQTGGQSGGQAVAQNGGQAQPGQPGRAHDTGPSVVDQAMGAVEGFSGLIYVGYSSAVLFALAFWIGMYNVMLIHLRPTRRTIGIGQYVVQNGGPYVAADVVILPILILLGVVFVETLDEGMFVSIVMSVVAAAVGAFVFGLPATILSSIYPGGPGFADIIVGVILLMIFGVLGAASTAVIANLADMGTPDDQGYEPHGR